MYIRWLPLVFCLFPLYCFSQTVGGRAAYSFLKLPATPILSSSGGVNVSYCSGDVGLTANNPALLQQNTLAQLNSTFTGLLAGVKAYSLTGAVMAEKLQTIIGGHIYYLDYGSLPMADAAGNIQGQFRPVDFVAQVSAARKYLERWTYGVTVKFISSTYGPYRSSALGADVGILYLDTAKLFSGSVVVKNIGTQLNTYSGQAEELPFDLQAGITKRLLKAPFGFSVTAQHLQKFDILYNDTTFNRNNSLLSSTSTLTKLVTHLVLAAHIYAGQNLEASIGYNFLQRQELSIGSEGNGLTGFSAGLRARFSKLQVFYARSAYQRGVAANQIGVTMHLDKLFGLGR